MQTMFVCGFCFVDKTFGSGPKVRLSSLFYNLVSRKVRGYFSSECIKWMHSLE